MVRSTLLQLLWVTGPSGKKQPFDISRDTRHKKGAVRNEYDRGTEKDEEVMFGTDPKIQIQRVWLEIVTKTARTFRQKLSQRMP